MKNEAVIKRRNPMKKEIMEKREGGKEKKMLLAGSLTIEAALSLTLFLFMVILLSVPIELLNVQRQIQMVLESTAREMSRQAWFPYQRVHGMETNGRQEEEEDGLIALFSQGAAVLYLEHTVGEAVGEKRLEKLDCSATRISADGELIDLRAEYRLKLPFSVFSLDSIPVSCRSRKRGWIGREGGYRNRENTAEEEITMVYVGKNSTRYHLLADCHYLSNQMTAVPLSGVAELKSRDGSYYKACHVCGAEVREDGMVYIFPNGEYYHSRKDCSSVGFYIREVPLTEVSHLGACSYCGGGK